MFERAGDGESDAAHGGTIFALTRYDLGDNEEKDVRPVPDRCGYAGRSGQNATTGSGPHADQYADTGARGYFEWARLASAAGDFATLVLQRDRATLPPRARVEWWPRTGAEGG